MDLLASCQKRFQPLDHIPHGACVLDRTFRVLFWNRCLEGWTGIRRGTILGTDIRERYAHFGKRIFRQRLETVFDGGPPTLFSAQLHEYILPVPLASGGFCVQLGTVTPVPGAGAEPLEFFALLTIEDVTELTQRVSQYRQMRDQAQAEVQARGRAERELQKAHDLLEEKVQQRTEELARANESLQCEIQERRDAEQQLRAAHTEKALLLESITSILISIDSGNRITQWNHEAEKILAIPAPQAIGQCLSDLEIFWDAGAILDGIEQCRLRGERIQLPEITFQPFPDRKGILELSASPIRNYEGEVRGVLLLGRDISGYRQLQMQLDQAQRLEAMGQLAAGIAHEINTPTQYVGDNTRFLQEGFSGMMEILESYRRLEELVRKGEGLDDALEEVRSRADSLDLDFLTEEIPASLRQSLEGLERVTRIVQAMKKFSHPGNDGQVSIDLNAVIENALTVCRNEWKYVADLQTDLQADLPEIQGLAGELNQVLLNVLINAAHAVEDRYGRDSEKGLIHISTRADGDYAEIRIRDTGCGIPAEHREKIFDLFYTTKEAGKGTGQGLAIARNVVVDKHGGSIDFTSETGEGTTFVIRLPFEGRSEDAPPVQEPSLEAVDA